LIACVAGQQDAVRGLKKAIRRRESVTLLGETVAAWLLVAHAQQAYQMRCISVLVATEKPC
jgi:hypothetical protein